MCNQPEDLAVISFTWATVVVIIALLVFIYYMKLGKKGDKK